MTNELEILDRIRELAGHVRSNHSDLIAETRGLAKTVSRVDKRVAVLEERSAHTPSHTQVTDAIRDGLRQHYDECSNIKKSIIPRPKGHVDAIYLAKVVGTIIAAIGAAVAGYHVGM